MMDQQEPQRHPFIATRAATQPRSDLLTVKQAADRAGLAPDTIRRLIRAGAIPTEPIRNNRTGHRIHRDDLDRFLAARSSAATA